MEPEREELASFVTWAVGTGRYSLTTARRMERTVRSLFKRLLLDKPSTERLWSYVERQLREGRRDGTINNQMKDIRAWMRFKGVELDVPKLRQRRSREPWIPSDEEVFAFISGMGRSRKTALRNRVLIEIMAFCGLRVGEVAQLNVSDLRENYLLVKSEKMEADRRVCLPGFVLTDLRTYLKGRRDSDDAMFVTSRGRLSYNSIRRMVKREGKKLGIDSLHPHALRHWCATRLVKSGVNLRAVQMHLGHANIATTQIYTHLSPEDVAKEVGDAFEAVISRRNISEGACPENQGSGA